MAFRTADRHGHRPGDASGPTDPVSRRATGARASFATGARLGWAIESNWTDPLLSAGLGAVIALGLGVAGLCLTIRREAWSYPEAIAGGLHLLSGAIFPPDVLPAALQPVALAVPLTWWLEGVRRALLGVATPGLLAGFSDTFVLLALCATTVLLTLGSWAVYRTFEHVARERGLIDQTTGS